VTNGTASPLIFGSEILFAGGPFGNLWVSDGTLPGTSQIPVAGVAWSGLDVSNLIVLGNDVLFAGRDASLRNGLWVTDGTAAGTSELTVSGAAASGLNPSDIVIIGNKALFAGQDASGHNGLWVSDGTAGGTSELTVAGAASTGLSPTDLTVSGNKVVFEGVDASGNNGLWVSDGTSGGTSEIPVTGAWITGLLLNPPHFFAFGTEVLFEGSDSTGRSAALWVTDGTSAGTSEIPAPGANEVGVLEGVRTPSFFALGSEVLFEGLDDSGHFGLWATDGTSAGASELTIAGSDTSAGIFAIEPPSFGLYGSEALFSGRDANGLAELWVSDGTAGGTTELSVAGVGTSGLRPRNPTAFTQNLIQPVVSSVSGGDSYIERA